MNPVATSDAAFRGGACPTPEYTIAYTGNYTTSADANPRDSSVWIAHGEIQSLEFWPDGESQLKEKAQP